jgi:hypothetical protein
MDEISLLVIIPEGAGILEARLCNHGRRLAPRPRDLLRGADKDAFFRSWEIDVEQPVVFADGWCPDPASIAVAANQVVALVHLQAWDNMADDRPVHKVGGLQDGNARHKVKTRCDQIVVRAVADDIRIGIIGEEDWVPISSFDRRTHGLRQEVHYRSRHTCQKRQGCPKPSHRSAHPVSTYPFQYLIRPRGPCGRLARV